MEKEPQAFHHEMAITQEDMPLLRLVEQARHQAFAVLQDYRTRAVLLVAPTGEVVVHRDVALLRAWLRHFAHCGTFGRRCFREERHVCACLPSFEAWVRSQCGGKMKTGRMSKGKPEGNR